MTERRRILMLAYFFPPLGGAGVQRALKFCRYLPEHGWEATVLTTRSTSYPVGDPSLRDEMPGGLRVVRAREPGMLEALRRPVLIACSVLRLRTLAGLVTWPDDRNLWGPFALLAGLREIRRQRPDVLLSTSAPYTSHLVALALHRLTGVPWVADFRDEWAGNPHVQGRSRLLRWLDRLGERAASTGADARIVVASYFDMEAEGKEPIEIPNGVDEADLDAPAAPVEADRFRLSYVGTIYGEQDLAPVLKALDRLVADGRLLADDVELRIVGNDWLEDAATRVGVPVTKSGYISHRAAVAEMRAASALLFYRAATSPAPSGKLYEYLASERPILCVARPDNLAYRLVSEWEAGVCADPRDEQAIEAGLLELYARWRAGRLEGSARAREEVLRRYSRRVLTARLAEVLDRVVTASAAP
jgi:glycosyltransferase involved in cell wall biosynthesis